MFADVWNGKEPRVSHFLFVMTLVYGRDLIWSSSKAQSTVKQKTVSQLQSCPLSCEAFDMWRIVFFAGSLDAEVCYLGSDLRS